MHVDDALRGSRLFADTATASAFFEQGFRGLSATCNADRCDGLSLHTTAWHVDAATVDHVSSSFFDDVAAFPPGSCELDCALVMRRIPVTWRALAPLPVAQYA